jgi:NADH-ubiquinone oxidoreductase chain 5
MLKAGLGANSECDLREIIALSTRTLRQLLLLVDATPADFVGHLSAHALFKALCFMCAGVIIHTMNDSQDIRFMVIISFQIPFTIWLGVSNFALCGMPSLAGFHSRALILEMVLFSYINVVGFFLLFVSTGLTVCFSFRLFYYVFCRDFVVSSFYLISVDNPSILHGIVDLLNLMKQK